MLGQVPALGQTHEVRIPRFGTVSTPGQLSPTPGAHPSVLTSVSPTLNVHSNPPDLIPMWALILWVWRGLTGGVSTEFPSKAQAAA